MKKILSFLMALALITGLNAAPVALKQLKAPHNTSRVALLQKQKALHKAPMAATVIFAPTDFVDQGTEGTGGPVSATRDGVTVSTDKGFGHRAYNSETKKYENPDQLRVYIGGKLTISATATITKIKFTFADDKDGGLSTSYTPNKTSWSVTLGSQARITDIEVSLDGDTPTPPTPSGDVEIKGLVYADAYYIDGYWDFDIYADDATDYFPEVYFSCYDEAPSQTSIVGTYDVFWAGYWASENDSVLTADEAVGSITVTCVEQGVYNFVGSLEGEDGKTYTWNAQNIEVQAWDEDDNEITLTDGGTPVPPTPGKDTIYSVINHPMVMDSIADFGWIYVSGGNDDYSLGIQVNTDHLLGEFTDEDIEMEYTQMIDWDAYDFVDIESIPSVIIAQVEDTLRFTVTVKATDGQVYVVTMNDYEAQPTGEETYVDIVLPEVYDETETEGWFQVLGYDVTGEYYASLCVNTDNMFGSFTDGDMDWEYTGVYIGETTVQLVENSMTITVSAVGDTVVYRAEVLDVEGMKWIITMKDFTPTPTEIIDLVTIEADGEYSAEYGDYYAMGVTADGDEISLDIYMDKLASGTFTIDDVETYYSGITLASGQLVEFYSADITLTVTGRDVLIEAVIIGRDIKQYNVTMEIAGPQPSGDHTIVIADYADVAFTTYDGAYTIATDANKGSDPVYSDNGEDLRLYAKNKMTLTKNTKDGPMTEITFNISTKGLTRQAEISVSTGKMVAYDMENAIVIWQGYASEVTFIVGEKNVYGSDGKTKAGQFDFTSIDIDGGVTGLISTKVNKVASKCLIDGQLLILKDDKQYNVLGVEF